MVNGRGKYWNQKLKERKLILFGAGDYARQFYRDFHTAYDFADCITNDEKETALVVDDCEVLPVHNPEELDGHPGSFIIVCAAQSGEIQQQLRALGYVYGEDFLESDVLRSLLSGKKLAVFYGVCYMRAVYTCLRESKSFQNEYESIYRLDYLQQDARQEQMFFLMLSSCDLFVCNAYLSENEQRKNKMYQSRLPADCTIISIPILIFNGYYPCDRRLTGKDNEYSVTAWSSPYAPFITPDREINRMIDEGRSMAEIKEKVSSVDYYERGYVRNNYQKEMRKLEMAESLATVQITDFLYEKHGKERTFLNEKHISNPVIRELAQRVLQKLGMTPDVPESVCDMRLLYTSEVPVYPSVIEALGLDIYRGKTTLFTFQGDVELTFEEYVEAYIDYCNSMKKYKKLGFFPS